MAANQITIEASDGKTYNFTVDHIRLHQEAGVAVADGKVSSNGQFRFSLLGWSGIEQFNDFKSEAASDIIL